MTEPVPASPAVQVLCKQFRETVEAERKELGRIAFATDAHKIPEGFVLNVDTARYEPPKEN